MNPLLIPRCFVTRIHTEAYPQGLRPFFRLGLCVCGLDDDVSLFEKVESLLS